jgi:sugar phosphate isomerase/epimerase
MNLALSTSWNAFRHNDGKSLISEIKAAGFKIIELSFNITPQIVEDIAKAVRSKQIKVISTHNFCPIPPGLSRKEALPDYYSLASPQERIRRKAIKYAKISIDTASRLQAKAVVMHSGKVEVPDRTKALINLYEKGLENSGEFKELRQDIIRERKENCKPFFKNALGSLEELARYAKTKNVSLGIENRFYYREIPTLEEIGVILETLKNLNVFYWHDTGHAEVMENLGFNRHKDYLNFYSQRMIGIHLHDLCGCRDHQAPGKGEFNFCILKSYLKKDTLKVLEAHHPASVSDLAVSKIFLEKLLNGKT